MTTISSGTTSDFMCIFKIYYSNRFNFKALVLIYNNLKNSIQYFHLMVNVLLYTLPPIYSLLIKSLLFN